MAAVGKEVQRSVEMLTVTPHTAVITVPHSPVLSDLVGLNLIQILPSRYLIVLEPGRALTEVELSLVDRIETLSPEQGRDHAILTELLGSLRAFRRAERARTGELILVEILRAVRC